MPNPWTAVDDLLHELGAIRRVAPEIAADASVRAAVERAIRDAADAVDLTIDAPADPRRLMAARDALGVAEELILALDAHLARALRARTRSEALRERARVLLAKAQAMKDAGAVTPGS